MPFKSEAQRRFMHARHPKIAKKWEKHTPKGKKLPEKVSSESFINRLNTVLQDLHEKKSNEHKLSQLTNNKPKLAPNPSPMTHQKPQVSESAISKRIAKALKRI